MSVPPMVHRSGDTVPDVPDKALDEDDDLLPECKIRRNYSCSSCVYFTQNPRNFLYHRRDEHRENVKIFECPNCLYASQHFQKLARHAKMVHGVEGVEAVDAGKSRKRKAEEEPPQVDDEEPEEEEEEEEESNEKEKSVTQEGTAKCSLCSFAARNHQQLAKHEREEHIKTKFFRCTKCTYVTHMKARFTKHVKYHSMPMIKCDMCDFRTPYKWNLDRHCKNHNGKGAFRCSACNFTADIKQSLTVHEMNHHVPPVGQGIPPGGGGGGGQRRRNKVGASDSAVAEEEHKTDLQVAPSDSEPPSGQHPTCNDNKRPAETKISTKSKSKGQDHQHKSRGGGEYGSSDFIHPDDIIHHANGNIYIKNKCKLCNFKTAWDGEMARHEQRVHNIVRPDAKPPTKKTPRPVPNLIPIPTQTSVVKLKTVERNDYQEPIMSQKDMNDICAKSTNSALRDFASLFGGEDVFKTEPDDKDTPSPSVLEKITKDSFKEKNASFFDKLKEKLMNGAGESCNLTCQYCGHESKCLSELSGHQKICGKERIQAHRFAPVYNISSSRCQYCRQRCKSSADLYNHLQVCEVANKLKVEDCVAELDIKVEEHPTFESKPHPMENRVFVWNNIDIQHEIEEEPRQQFYVEDKQDDNISLDLSIRTHSPNSENSYLEIAHSAPITDKVPTHGNDITIAQVAQHKRVFKCPHCSFWASTASRFHVHIVGHLNKKPFECSLCAYKSNWRWDITKHIKLKSVRDPAHEKAKVLMTDETGRRNYTKYNKYLTEIPVSGDHNETSGGAGTRHRNTNQDNHDSLSAPRPILPKPELPKLIRAPTATDFSPLLKSPLRPPPPLKSADEFFAKIDKKRAITESKKTLWKCKKCNFRDASHEKLLEHVKGHYQPDVLQIGQIPSSGLGTDDERHCRLKHSGDIRVVIGGKNGPERVEVEEQLDEPDHVDLLQLGTFKCKKCPFSNNDHDDFELHLLGHVPKPNSIMKCYFCDYFVAQKEDLLEHLKLHGITEPEDYMTKMLEKSYPEIDSGKRYKCITCPYVTNSKSQFLYHKQFHKPRGGQYTCTYCTYNVSKRHLLHQHLKVHGINITPQKQNGEVIDLDELPDESDEALVINLNDFESQNFPDIPLVWVSKGGKFSKMFKCRYCPHVNLRKVNIQEHEKMHGQREKSKGNDVEHHCLECSYVCNNAGVLSSHSKVHQGMYGEIHCLVDPTKSDDEQMRELSRFVNSSSQSDIEPVTVDDEKMDTNDEENGDVEDESQLYFCEHCPARFFKENEFSIHNRFHMVRLYYKCEYCTYTARQKHHLLAHNKVHSYEYQERTKELQAAYSSSTNHPQPKIGAINQNGEIIWIVTEIAFRGNHFDEAPKTMSVPLSGTELFHQRNEAQKQNRIAARNEEPLSTAPLPVDPQFGTLMHGNPKFVYPTYLKNGRMKEKRYKCHKCPSAFEKREQYKVHLSLHGAKQRYKCDHCDYSVKYYANYVQHLKKHQMNADAQASRKSDPSEDEENEEEVTTTDVVIRSAKSVSPRRGSLKLSVADRQALMILNQRRDSASSSKEVAADDKKLHWCPSCPYTNYRKDAVDNHHKRHVSASGFKNTFTCEHCDYSVPQAHFLREHMKLHFVANKINQPEGYMYCDKLKLTSQRINSDDEKLDNDDVIFEDQGLKANENRFVPSLSDEVLQRLNNNEGEKVFINKETGEILKDEKMELDETQEGSSSSEGSLKIEDDGQL